MLYYLLFLYLVLLIVCIFVVFVSTASAPDESSWGWYCGEDTCLGDLFSISWMERLDHLNYSEPLFEQFDAVRTRTLQKSHVNLYGDYKLGFLKFGKNSFNSDFSSNNEAESEEDSGVNSRDVPLYLAEQAVKKATDLRTRQEKESNLEKIVKGRAYADNIVSEILQYIVKDDFYQLKDLESKRYPLREDVADCYKSLVSSFDEKCFKITKHTYFLKHMYKFVNICANGFNADEITEVMEKLCSQRNDLFELIV